MAATLPAHFPATLGEAFARINAVTAPTIDDLKIMVLVEAAGLELYNGMARGTDNAEVIALLQHNGREELAHAHRVAKAIHTLTGEEFAPPSSDENPYLTVAPPAPPILPEVLKRLAQGEFGGEALYESWAANIGNEAAAQQFRLNGKEEADHGQRLLDAAALLEA